MNTNTRKLHDLGQRLWLDNITRDLLDTGTLAQYIADLSVTGVTSNPTIFEKAISSGTSYDLTVRTLAVRGLSDEDIFFELALQDLTRAADLLMPVFDASEGVDGWVSLEVSPLLAADAVGTIRAAAQLHARAARPNLFIKIPGTPQGLPAIEQSIFEGVPVNVTLLFSREQYLAAAEAYLRGVERRMDSGLSPKIQSVASLFVSRWDAAANHEFALPLHNRLGIAVAQRCYQAHCELLASDRWRLLAAKGSRPQRLLWASTGCKDPKARDTLYVEALVAPETINTMPEPTLLAFADHGHPGVPMPADGGNAEEMLKESKRAGVDDQALAAQLQRDGVVAFAKSWGGLLAQIRRKRPESVVTAKSTTNPI